MAGNPRIDELRKRLEKEPGSRLFAQLAEELRKEGEFEEAIRVCRDGLQTHPAYPSARMTLGRALLDTGDLAGARGEFEAVLKGAADNILASRFLAECLDGLGDLAGAKARYQTTLLLAPGDKQVLGKLEALEARLKAPVALPAAGAPAATAAPPVPEAIAPPIGAEAAAQAELPPIRLSEVEGPLELEQPGAPPAMAVPAWAPAAVSTMESPEEREPPPIPVMSVEEPFELERPYEAPSTAVADLGEEAPLAAHERAGVSQVSAMTEPSAEVVFEPEEATSTLPLRTRVPEFVQPAPGGFPEDSAEIARPGIERAPAMEPPRAEAAAPPHAPPPPAPDLNSATLAELYFNQGFTDKAMEVYRQLILREPGNERARARLAELDALERHLRAEEGRGAPRVEVASAALEPRQARRRVLERTIARLEGLLAAIRKG